MYKKYIFLFFFFLLLASWKVLAVTCPDHTAFHKISGLLWGTKWDLVSNAKKDWVISPTYNSFADFFSPSESDFPSSTKLKVELPLEVKIVRPVVAASCIYDLPDGKMITLNPSEIYSIAVENKLDFTVFHYNGQYYVCEETAGSVARCQWEWS